MRSLASSVVVAVLLPITAALAAEETRHRGFWAGFDVGAGYVMRSAGSQESGNGDFYLGLKAGYWLNARILTGFELSGWNQQSTDRGDPTKGEGLMQAFFISRLYPMEDSNLFAKVGGGWVRQWSNSPSGKSALDGWGATVGVGYDYSLDGRWAVTPFFNYGFGKTEDQKHQALTLGVGISFD